MGLHVALRWPECRLEWVEDGADADGWAYAGDVSDGEKMKIYGYTAAGALARFLATNEGDSTPEYLLENAFRYWKNATGSDTKITGEGNYNKEFNYKDLEDIVQ